MKKFALILLICIYAVATMGFSLKELYCCGSLKAVTLAIVQDTKQECSSENEKRSCCDNKYQFFKVKDKHITSEQVISPPKHFIDLNLFNSSFDETAFPFQKNTSAYRSNAPPLAAHVPLYIYNCVFRI